MARITANERLNRNSQNEANKVNIDTANEQSSECNCLEGDCVESVPSDITE
jgi:hypothetical protein